MKTLNYEVLKESGYQGYVLKDAPERVLQFGEGNFLRAFVDYFIDNMNEKAGFNGKVVLTQPIAPGLAPKINEQEGLYTLYLRGFEDGKKVNQKRVISAVSRCLNPYEDFGALLDCAKNPDLRFIISNTTEAGIVYDKSAKFDQTPPDSFPAKLTRFLYERFQNKLPGFIILSCELIDHNGQELKKCVEHHIKDWKLGDEFADWVAAENVFCSTLVDRIVTGYPRTETEKLNEENGYIDNLLDTGEIFGFWVIEGPKSIQDEFPFEKAGLPIIVVKDHTPYKQRKVRILNGAHTSMVLAAYRAGQNIVRNCMEDAVIRGFMEKAIYDEIIPTLTLPKAELTEFAAAVTERFQNPFIDHSLLAIALNSTSKWRARVMPSFQGYVKEFDALPPCLTFSFAAYINFYHAGERLTDDAMIGKRGEEEYEIKDDRWVLEFFMEHKNDDNKKLSQAVCSNEQMWGEDLSQVPGFAAAVSGALDRIDAMGMYEAMKGCLG